MYNLFLFLALLVTINSFNIVNTGLLRTARSNSLNMVSVTGKLTTFHF